MNRFFHELLKPASGCCSVPFSAVCATVPKTFGAFRRTTPSV